MTRYFLSDFKQWWAFSKDLKENFKNRENNSSDIRADACGEHLMNLKRAFRQDP
jgi:hypothetical protein